MKSSQLLLTLGFLLLTGGLHAQSAGEYFNRAARSYVKTEHEKALSTLDEGLKSYPNDAKLQALKDKLNQEKKEQEDQQQEEQNQEQQEQNQENQSGQGEQEQNQDQGEKSSQDQAEQSQSGSPEEQSGDPADENANDQMDANLADRQKALEEFKEKLSAMNLTPEQAEQILESMNAAQLRFIQQNQKKRTKRPDKGLPDW